MPPNVAGTHMLQVEGLHVTYQGESGSVHAVRGVDFVIDEGEFFIVPRGVEHKPVTEAETHVLLLEPTSTLNTGNVRNDRTIDAPRRL